MSAKNLKNKKSQKSNSKLIIIGVVLALAAIAIFVLEPLLTKKSETDSIMEEYVFKKEGELKFLDSLKNEKVKINIEIADDNLQRQLGLMFRKEMNEFNGMLFIFDVEEPQSFWMHNTFIPLDMMFVDANNKIVTIQHAVQTLSDQSYASTKPAKYVVEVNLGFTEKYDIKEGDYISFTKL